MYIDSINKNSIDCTLSSFGKIIVCSNGINDLKSVTFPIGYNKDLNLTFKILFVYGHNCANAMSNMTLNGIPIVVNRNGTLIPLPIHAFGNEFKSLQANTILEMYYTNTYNGNNEAYIVVGNPVVLSSDNYTIYADGYNGSEKNYPIGTVYQNKTNSADPVTLFGFGHWTQITDSYLAARGSAYIKLADGGEYSHTLVPSNIPQHAHGMEHTHAQQGTFETISQTASTTSLESANHTHTWGAWQSILNGVPGVLNYGGGSDYEKEGYSLGTGNATNNSAYTIVVGASGEYGSRVLRQYVAGTTSAEQTAHAHTYEHKHNLSISGNTTGASKTTTDDYGSATPDEFLILPKYTGLYVWYRDQ